MTLGMSRLASWDSSLSRRFTLPKESLLWPPIRIIAHIGDGQYVFGALVSIYLLGWFFDKPVLRSNMLTITTGVIVTMIVVTLIKFVVRRPRPRPPGEFVQYQYDKYSFPSGHAARMAALAVGTLYFYPFLGLFLTAVALVVAAARVMVGIHYIGDIVVGMVAGVLVGWGTILVLTGLSLIP